VRKDVDKLIAKLSGYDRPSENATISELIRDADDDLIERLERDLAKSQWPLCNSLAAALGRINNIRSKTALLNNLTARRHHVRTAVINAMVVTADALLATHIEPFLADSAFETRIAARDAMRALTGREVKTARGE
jgi:hypothetical protein